jgi:iron complex outermembrane recepter protein
LVPYLPLSQRFASSQTERVYSLFGSAKWRITDEWSLSGGMRNSWVDKEAVGTVSYGTGTKLYDGFVPLPTTVAALPGALFGNPAGSRAGSPSDHAFMPSAELEYQPSSNQMVYLSYKKGFKAGGFNGFNPTAPNPADAEFGPEHVNAYELGLKSKWFDNRMLVNVDVFRSDYKDLQVQARILNTATGLFTTTVKNAAKSRSEGAEAELRWVINDQFQLATNFTYLESTYISFTNAPPTVLASYCRSNYLLPYCSGYTQPVPAVSDLSGQPTQFAPKWSGSVTASYSTPLSNDYRFTAKVIPYVTSRYNSDPELDALGASVGTPGYVRWDATLTLANERGDWAVDLIGKNLSNRVIVAYSGLYAGAKQEPINGAIQLRHQW